MHIAVFSTKPYDQRYLSDANTRVGFTLTFLEPRLTLQTSALAAGANAVCLFVNDRADEPVVRALAERGVRLIALRCAGYNNVDLRAAAAANIRVVRVPAYSPYAVAEHTVALMLALNRHTHRAVARVRDGNFSLDGLLGFDLHGRTVGVVGTGRIGLATIAILRGFGCRVLAFDPLPSPAANDMGAEYTSLERLFAESDVVTLHCPLSPATRHLIDGNAIGRMKRGVMLINTSRGALVDARAAIDALKSGHLGYLGLDVYEEEADLFFEDLSSRVLQDDVLARLLTFPNVIVTSHQAFFTHEALSAIAETTLSNVRAFVNGDPLDNEVRIEGAVAAAPTPPSPAPRGR
jgi:D-lactate dehydrogenase